MPGYALNKVHLYSTERSFQQAPESQLDSCTALSKLDVPLLVAFIPESHQIESFCYTFKCSFITMLRTEKLA